MALGCSRLVALRSHRASICLLIRDKEKGRREKIGERETESESEEFFMSSTLNPLLKSHKYLESMPKIFYILLILLSYVMLYEEKVIAIVNN